MTRGARRYAMKMREIAESFKPLAVRSGFRLLPMRRSGQDVRAKILAHNKI